MSRTKYVELECPNCGRHQPLNQIEFDSINCLDCDTQLKTSENVSALLERKPFDLL
ncbi:hypothetical protein ACFO0N_15090 [Halobium salinum]|uniref:Uncharacterized protein n=1 Tax=Halobium salinum TaxID=1364940 RepID=A0ABD5PEF7_9EURY|nr:hypothetical protein [Halobium salinum]